MHTGIVAAERIGVQPSTDSWSPGDGWARTGTLHSVLSDLRAAKLIINDLSFAAISQLDQEGMYSLSMVEGLIAGAILKIEAAGGKS